MTKNKSRKMQQAVRLLEQTLEIDAEDQHALPGTALRHIKEAKRVLLQHIRKRRDGREREIKRKGES